MAKGVTPLRSLRVPDEVWLAARSRADALGTTLSEVMVTALADFAGVEVPERRVGGRAPARD